MLKTIFPLMPATTFGLSAYGIMTGEFRNAGFANEVLPLHIWINGFESIGWILCAILFFKKKFPQAAYLSLFLAGMWCWDMITTMYLQMPVPPMQNIWGPASVIAMVVYSQSLFKQAKFSN